MVRRSGISGGSGILPEKMMSAATISSRNKITVIIFCLLTVAFFLVFTFLSRPQYQQPETILDRYYANQDGLMDGPLRSSVRFRDLIRPFMYNPMTDEIWRCRPLANIPVYFDAKLLVWFRDWFGPVEFFSSQILVVLLTAWALAIFARDFTGNRLVGWMTGACWLLTYEAMAYSVLQTSPAKMGAAAFNFVILTQFLRFRDSSGKSCLSRYLLLGALFFLAFLTDDSIYATLILAAMFVILQWDQYRGRHIKLSLAVLSGVGAYVFFLFFVGLRFSAAAGGAVSQPYLGGTDSLVF